MSGVWHRASDPSMPPVVVAEFGDSHFGSVESAKKMCSEAKAAGADVVKFQHHIPADEMLKEIPLSSNMKEPLWDFLSRNALEIGDHHLIALHCQEIGIQYLCTPFSYSAALELEEVIGPPVYKIGSGEMLDFPTIEKISEFGKPIIVSTGMSTLAEVDEAYSFLLTLGVDFCLMNCTSGYPPKLSEANLGFLSKMRERYPQAIIGNSDHFPNADVAKLSVAFGARFVEKHVSPGGGEYGPDEPSSISFEELRSLIQSVQSIHKSLNSDKTVQKSEEEIRLWAHRSIVYLRDLKAGDKIKTSDIWGKRPGTGVPSRFMGDFVGRVLANNVLADTLLKPEDFD